MASRRKEAAEIEVSEAVEFLLHKVDELEARIKRLEIRA